MLKKWRQFEGHFVCWKNYVMHRDIDGSFNNPTTQKDKFLVTELEDIDDSIEGLYCSNIMCERSELIRPRGFLPKKRDFLINPVVGKTTNLLCKLKGVLKASTTKKASCFTVHDTTFYTML